MKRFILLTFFFLGALSYSFSQTMDPNDRDKSKYAVNNFVDDDKYTMLEPYETVSVEEPSGH